MTESADFPTSDYLKEIILDTSMMCSDIFDYLYAHDEVEFNLRKTLLIDQIEELELSDGV